MTTFNPLTYNAHIQTIGLDQLIERVRSGHQNTLLTFIDNMNDLWRIEYLQTRLPGVTIFTRCWNPNDFRFHEEGGDNGWMMSPASFLNVYGVLGTQNRVLCAMNEPHGYANIIRLAQWTTELLREANRRNQGKSSEQKIHLCVLNFGTGHPASLNGKDMEWTYEFDSILIELAKNEDHYLGLHEYMPGHGFRVGRFKQALARCARLKVKPPRIFISEYGVDSAYDGDPQNGFRSRSWSEEYYFNYLVEAYNQEYSLYVKSKIIVGLAIFCYGDSGGWGNFRVDNAGTFLYLMATRAPKEEVVMPVTYPAWVSKNDPSWRTVLAQRIGGGGGYIRSVPTTTGNLPLPPRITDGKLIKITDTNPYGVWRQVIVDGTQGWTSMTYLKVVDAIAENPVVMLTVPYVSQLGNTPQNDCGPASLLMLIQNKLQRVGLKPMTGLTLATVLAETPGGGNNTMNVADLSVLASKFGMDARVLTPLSHEKIKISISAGVPMLVLVAYKHILPSDSFKGGHFVVVVGIGDKGGYWVHDPYHGGPNLYLSASQFEQAVTDVSAFASTGWQGLSL